MILHTKVLIHSFMLMAMLNWSSKLSGQELVGLEWLDFISKKELTDKYGDIFNNGVDLYKIRYTTTDWDKNIDTCSGLLVVPDIPIQGLPLTIYLHGTINFNDSVPSNLPLEATIPIVYGGAGSISMAPDYLGFGYSKGFHPYMHAKTEASTGRDMILGVLKFVDKMDFILNGQLFISGYSQGGHAAMALHRLLEEDPIGGLEITASAFMSGAYSLSGIMYETLLGKDEYSDPAFVMNILLSYNMIYSMYNDLAQLFREPYDSLANLLFQEDINLGRMNEILIDKLNEVEGAVFPKKMIQDSILVKLNTTDNHPIQNALKDNDVFNWAPQSPVLLVYCPQDEKVPYENALLADSVMRMNGAPSVILLLANETLLHLDCAEPSVLGSLLFFQTFIVSDVEITLASRKPIFYPNPAKHNLKISHFPLAGQLRLFDLYGRLVIDEVFYNETINLLVTEMNAGTYFWTINFNDSFWKGKIVVSN